MDGERDPRNLMLLRHHPSILASFVTTWPSVPARPPTSGIQFLLPRAAPPLVARTLAAPRDTGLDGGRKTGGGGGGEYAAGRDGPARGGGVQVRRCQRHRPRHAPGARAFGSG